MVGSTLTASKADPLSGEFPPSKQMVARSMGTLRSCRQLSQHSCVDMVYTASIPTARLSLADSHSNKEAGCVRLLTLLATPGGSGRL